MDIALHRAWIFVLISAPTCTHFLTTYHDVDLVHRADRPLPGGDSIHGELPRISQFAPTLRPSHLVTVTARRRRHHQSRTTRVWNVLDGKVQGRSWVLDSGCAARGGLGFWVLVARREEVSGSGFWLRGARRSWVLGSGCPARGGFGFLAAQRGEVMLGLAVRCEEGSGCGGAH